jgi:cephalosporin-C deacetylase
MPLTFDLPFDELESYAGRNPRPDGFDAYWDRGIEEMCAIDAQIEMIPADFQIPFADCFHLYFTGIGGARVHAKLIRPKHVEEPHPAVLMFHGYAGSAGEWSSDAKLSYVANGFTVAALDCRGQGGLSDDVGGVGGWTWSGHIVRGLMDALNGEPDKLLFRAIFLDTAQLARIVMSFPEVDANRVGATGASQGGGLTVACASLEPRIKRLAPIYPFLSDYQRVWEIDLAQDAYAELVAWFKRFDPMHKREEDLFSALGYIDIQHLAPRITGEVLWSCCLMDAICPPSSQFAAYNKIRSQKSMNVYPDYGHDWPCPGSADAVYQFMAQL